MLIEVHYAGSDQPYLVNIDAIASITVDGDNPRTIIRLTQTDELGNYKKIMVRESYGELKKLMSHFIAKHHGHAG